MFHHADILSMFDCFAFSNIVVVYHKGDFTLTGKKSGMEAVMEKKGLTYSLKHLRPQQGIMGGSSREGGLTWKKGGISCQ